MTANTDMAQARLQKLQGYLNADPNNFTLLSEASDLALQCGDWGTAKTLVERALALQPQDNVTRYRMAVILLSEDKPQESLAITQSLLDAGEAHPAVRYEYGRGLFLSSRFAEAEPVFAALLPEAASFAELPYLYIRTLHFLGKVKEAAAFAEDFLKVRPDDSLMQGMLGLLYLDDNDIDKAAALSAASLKLAPDNIDALVTCGTVALAFEKEDEAKSHFDKAVALHAENGRAWAGLGLVNMLKRDLPSAERDFEKAVRYMPTHLGSYNALAWIQLLQKNYAAAKKTLEAALSVDRTFGETYGSLAVLATMEGDWDEAKRLAETAVRLQPESFSGRFAQSLILEHRGHPERAKALVESLLKNATVPGGGNLLDVMVRFGARNKKA